MFKNLCLTAAMVAAAATSFAGDLVINGSTTVLPVVQKATEAFAKTNPDVHIALSGGGSGNGVKALIDGLTNIAMSSRDIKASEVKLAEQRGVKPYRTAVAVDAIVPVVNNANTVKDLTQEQLKAVFEGKIRNWKEVGGKDAPIVVVSRDSSSGTFETWESLVMNTAPPPKPSVRGLLQVYPHSNPTEHFDLCSRITAWTAFTISSIFGLPSLYNHKESGLLMTLIPSIPSK